VGKEAVQFGNSPCLLRIRSMYSALRPSEKRIAQYIMENADHVIHLTITEVGQQCQVSEATVVKFAQRLGYDGFHDLKIRLATELHPKEESIYGEIHVDDPMDVVQSKVFDSTLKALQETKQLLNPVQTAQAVELISQARLINLFGVGASGLVCLDAEEKFTRIGLLARAYRDSRSQAVAASLMRECDVAIAVSYSGETPDVVYAFRTAREAGAKCIAITNYSGSQITEYAQITLLTSAPIPVFRSGAMASRIAQLSVIDTLFVGTAIRRYAETLKALEQTEQALRGEQMLRKGGLQREP
jgi:DNA-binding MurR/RpiR family transcriptional regulator